MLTPWGYFAVADAHVHFFSRKFFSALGSQAGKTAEQVAEAAGWVLPAEDPAGLARSWAGGLEARGGKRGGLSAAVPGAAGCGGRAGFVHCGVLTVGIRKKLGLDSPFEMRFSNPLELHGPALR